MEACATSHYWAREIAALDHEVRMMVFATFDGCSRVVSLSVNAQQCYRFPYLGGFIWEIPGKMKHDGVRSPNAEEARV
jgi:hypothetical protein